MTGSSLKKTANFSKFTVSVNTDTEYTHGWLARLPDGYHWGYSTARCRALVAAQAECGHGVIPEIVVLRRGASNG